MSCSKMTNSNTSDCKRFGKRWTINECLQLEREFDLLKLPINEIAQRHHRTPNAIMFKLDAEGIANYHVIYFNSVPNYNLSSVELNPKYEQDDESTQEDSELSDSETMDCEEADVKTRLTQLEQTVTGFTDLNVMLNDVLKNENRFMIQIQQRLTQIEQKMDKLNDIISKQPNNCSGVSSYFS